MARPRDTHPPDPSEEEAALKDPYQRLMARNIRELNHHLWELRDSIAIVADWMQKTEQERQERLERQARERRTP
jgi:Mg2+ and Co2+ transporter CorA